MDDNQKTKRPEATHRQAVALTEAPVLPLGNDGQPMSVISCSASQLTPTVQFGNVLFACSVTRAVHDSGDDDALVQEGIRVAGIASAVVGRETRILQWALDPSLKVTNPSGAPTSGAPSTPAMQPGDQVQVTAQPVASPGVPTPPSAQ